VEAIVHYLYLSAARLREVGRARSASRWPLVKEGRGSDVNWSEPALSRACPTLDIRYAESPSLDAFQCKLGRVVTRITLKSNCLLGIAFALWCKQNNGTGSGFAASPWVYRAIIAIWHPLLCSPQC